LHLRSRTLDSTDFFTNDLSLVDPNSPDVLANRILLLVTQRDRYDELRKWGLTSVQSMSLTSMAQRNVEFWARVQSKASVIAQPRGPGR